MSYIPVDLLKNVDLEARRIQNTPDEVILWPPVADDATHSVTVEETEVDEVSEIDAYSQLDEAGVPPQLQEFVLDQIFKPVDTDVVMDEILSEAAVIAERRILATTAPKKSRAFSVAGAFKTCLIFVSLLAWALILDPIGIF